MCSTWVLGRLVLIGCLFGSAQAQVNFSQVAINSEDTQTASVAEGDFDNDGTLDLVSINQTTLSFYKGLGQGNYANSVNQPLPQYQGQAFAADFNRDGNLDLAIGAGPYGGTGDVSIYLGNGDGTFRLGGTVPVNGNASFLALADFNGDHLPDIAVSICTGAGACSDGAVFLGNGDGTFHRSAKLPTAGYQIVTGDFNADGHQDIAVISSDIFLYLGEGNGKFAAPLHANLGSVSSIAVGDFYHNRIQSLVALVTLYDGSGDYESDLYAMRYAHGQIVRQPKYVITPNTGDPFLRVIAGDLNGDFKDDLFFAGGNVWGGSVSGYMLGAGKGAFQPMQPAPYWLDIQDFPLIRDLDLDGRHDVAMPWISIFDNQGGMEALRNTNAKVNCPPPGPDALGVNVCAPADGQQVGKIFTFRGAGNARDGHAKRMELWIDGQKVAQNLEDQLRAKVSLKRGKHKAEFVVVNSFDNHVAKGVEFIAVY